MIPDIIDGVVWKPLRRYNDARGWLIELFRLDELPGGIQPAMAYVSETLPGVARGPHEHVAQSDYFCFLGPSRFKVYLWDNRADSPTFGVCQKEIVGAGRPFILVVPPGVVHAYQNVGEESGIVWNCPDKLFKGPGRTEPVDEIRHENDPKSPFQLDELNPTIHSINSELRTIAS